MKLKSFIVSFLVLVSAVLPLAAQTQTGQLTGSVRQDAAALPGVRVTIASPALQGTRTTETDINGNYSLSALPPGQYTIAFELEGLSTVNRVVNVTLSGVARADADMKVSAVNESITVTATSPSVIETNAISTNISSKTVDNLPVGRTLLATVDLAPGTNTNGPRDATTISGAASYDSTFYINGTPVNEVLRGQPLDLFIEDALQETTVLSGSISAEYGRFTGGVVNAISKSGGNGFSGSFRDTVNNAAWAEPSPLDEDLLDKTSQTFEATLGGRIIRDRLWFFGAGRYANRSLQNFFSQSTESFSTATEQKRIEGKLTGQISQKHSLTGSFLNLVASITDRCLAANCWDARSLSMKEDQPQDLYSLSYSGVLTGNSLIEAFWSKSSLRFGGSGAPRGDVFTATPNYYAGTGEITGSSVFCGDCGEELRAAKTYGIKPHYYLSTASAGTHNLVAGYEHYVDEHDGNNHQSGSDFFVYNFASPQRGPNGEVLDTIRAGSALVLWWPILADSKTTRLATDSVFVNDRWDLNSHLSFNVGFRFDKNDGTDSSGKQVADDSKLSPRLGATYDVFGNGRLRLNASYSQYVSKIQSGNIGEGSSVAGQPSQLYWLYGGPTITAPHDEFIRRVFEWFNSTGGTNNRNFFGAGGYLLGGGANGVASQIEGSLESPGVTEVAFGVASQLGRDGFVRFDYQDRKWSDFYERVLNLGTGTIFDPLVGTDVDKGLITNSRGDLERKYRALIVQAGWQVAPTLNLQGNYTWSKLRGNTTDETINAGPIPNTGVNYYPEIAGYDQQNPIGYLAQDQRHKARVWLSYDLGTKVGRFNFTLLENYDSGLPYSAAQFIDPIASGVEDPGYVTAASASAAGFPYFFSKRGEYRFANFTSTDVGVNYNLPLSRAMFFIQADILNVLNQDAQIAGNTRVETAFTDGSLETFNPFTDTPVEGVHWQKGPLFGQATVPGSYQTPRTYRFSLGVKF